MWFTATLTSRYDRFATLKVRLLNTHLLLDRMLTLSSRGKLGWRYRVIDPLLFKPDFLPAYGLLQSMPLVLTTTLRISDRTTSQHSTAHSVSSRARKKLLYLVSYYSLDLRLRFDLVRSRNQQVVLFLVYSMTTTLLMRVCCVDSI